MHFLYAIDSLRSTASNLQFPHCRAPNAKTLFIAWIYRFFSNLFDSVRLPWRLYTIYSEKWIKFKAFNTQTLSLKTEKKLFTQFCARISFLSINWRAILAEHQIYVLTLVTYCTWKHTENAVFACGTMHRVTAGGWQTVFMHRCARTWESVFEDTHSTHSHLCASVVVCVDVERANAEQYIAMDSNRAQGF